MRNMGSIIASLNKTILRSNIQYYGCNCRKKSECPMRNKCLTPNILYEAIATNSTDIVKKYTLDYGKIPLTKVTVTILDLSGYKVIAKIKNYLNMYRN